MKAYVITTKDSKRLLDGEIRDYPDCLPECEVVYGPEPDANNYPPHWFKCIRPEEKHRRHAWCCYLSKIYCLQDHLKRYPDEDCIIFEDDVTFSPHFYEIYTGFMRLVPDDWDFIWFDYKMRGTANEIKPGILTSEYFWYTGMNIFRAKIIPSLIEDLKKEYNLRDCEVDRVLCALSKKYKTYFPLFSACGQCGGYSYIRRSNCRRHDFTSTKYKSLDGTIKYSSIDDYKVYLQ